MNTGTKQARNSTNGTVVPSFRGDKKRRYEALLRLRDELADQVRDLSSASLSYTKEPGEDQADVGSDNFTRDMGLTLMSEEGRKISLIQDAIQSLIDNTYGVCVDCRNTISSGRLDAIPYAKLCIECKTAREKNGDLPPHDGEGDEVTE